MVDGRISRPLTLILACKCQFDVIDNMCLVWFKKIKKKRNHLRKNIFFYIKCFLKKTKS